MSEAGRTGDVERFTLGFPWATTDPFLFCVHHLDHYPRGDDRFAPVASLAGRRLGMDFEIKDGFRMYHGLVVPGFPQHPHRGFETVTLARRGRIDHSDSLGAAARFGDGDVQWMTAGRGVVHSEMFPLLDRDGPNTVELFQLWLNLPAADKMVEPHFKMLWADSMPSQRLPAAGAEVEVRVIAGDLFGASPPSPPPRSYASRADADVAIVTLRIPAGASVTVPAARSGDAVRSYYAFEGREVRVDGVSVRVPLGARLTGREVVLEAVGADAEVLLLQGVPIGEPAVQYGPFVMNSAAEVQQAMMDYRRTGFGGWPWPSDEPVHPRDAGRFARRPDGAVERPDDTTER